MKKWNVIATESDGSRWVRVEDVIPLLSIVKVALEKLAGQHKSGQHVIIRTALDEVREAREELLA